MILDKLPFSVTGLIDANRPIRLRLSTSKGVVENLLLVKYVSGVETICGGIEYSLLCVSSRAGMELKQFVANPIELQFVTDSGGLRSVCGIVGAVVEGQSDGGLATYQLIVRDAFSLLEQTCNTRVFRNASEVDITNTVLREWFFANPVAARAFRFDMGKLKNYPSREFTMQYNESNAAFLRRLWKRRGISWFIQAGSSTQAGSDETAPHTLVLFDDAMSLQENAAGPARYHRDHGTEQRDSITAWHAVRTLTAGRVTRHSWDYKQSWPMGSNETSVNDQGALGNQFAAALDEYLIDPPHTGGDSKDYRDLTLLSMQRKEYEAKYFEGEGGDRNMRVGQWRRIDGHPEIDVHPADERDFVCTELRVEAENNLPKTIDDRVCSLFALNRWNKDRAGFLKASDERGMRYTNRFACVRRGIPIVPAYDPRIDLPRTEPQTATVVGPVNDEIHCDELGRIKVRFPACRPQDHEHAQGAGASDTDRDSAWLRHVTGWAGNRYGAISLPRVGDEVAVVFLGGDPDKPLIIGSVHGAKTPPPAFSHTSRLPGDKHLSGIVSKEGQAQRRNQLRLDDTPGQISAQLASEHGHSQLNLGYLTHPRSDGKTDPRGEGAELRTDAALSLRGGQGVLISADASLRAAGRQLERDGLVGLSEALVNIQKQVAELAKTHGASVADTEALVQVSGHLAQWEHGSNAATGTAGDGGGAPIVALAAPAGILLGSGAGISMGAQTHVDVVSVGNTQISSGRKLILHALQGISVFAHTLGAKLIAASGKVEVQAHDDNVEITSAKRIVLVASDEIIMQAPKVTIVAKGAQAAYGGGAITHQCTGSYVVKSAKAEFPGAGDGSPMTMKMPASSAEHDQRVRIVDLSTGEPLANQRYRATMEDGQVVEGMTDAKVARAIIHPDIGNLNEQVLGVVHGVMPAMGAGTAYKRVRCGFEGSGIKARILGHIGSKVTSVLGNSQGGLELLPSQAYGNHWLQVKHNGATIKSLPEKGDPYEEIYKVRGKWFSLLREEWINPGKMRESSFKQTCGLLDRAKDFHNAIADMYHNRSYAHYGADSAGAAWHKVVWEIDKQAQVQNVDLLAIVADDEKGNLRVTDPTLIVAANEASAKFDVKLLDPAEPGDQTVPLHSADAQLRSGKFQGIFRQTGYEHQGSYSDSAVLAATLYSLFRIASTMEWSK